MKISYKVSSLLSRLHYGLPPVRFLRRLGIFLLHDLRERLPDVLSRLRTMLQPLDEILVSLLSHPALLCCPRRAQVLADFAALRRRSFAVPLKSVGTGEVVATEIAKVHFQWVRLRGIAMPLEFLEVVKFRVRA